MAQITITAPLVPVTMLTPDYVAKQAADMEQQAEAAKRFRLRWFGAVGIAALLGAGVLAWRRWAR